VARDLGIGRGADKGRGSGAIVSIGWRGGKDV
jgi:hypothetical protein